jgi:hypothetical protein
MKLEVAVNVDTLTQYALDMVKGESDPVAVILGANKREIFALARANIQAYGQDTALVNVPQTVPAAELDQVKQHVRSMFPEID